MIFYANPKAQFQSYQSEIEDAILTVARSNSYVLGREVLLIEEEFSRYIGTSSAIGVPLIRAPIPVRPHGPFPRLVYAGAWAVHPCVGGPFSEKLRNWPRLPPSGSSPEEESSGAGRRNFPPLLHLPDGIPSMRVRRPWPTRLPQRTGPVGVAGHPRPPRA